MATAPEEAAPEAAQVDTETSAGGGGAAAGAAAAAATTTAEAAPAAQAAAAAAAAAAEVKTPAVAAASMAKMPAAAASAAARAAAQADIEISDPMADPSWRMIVALEAWLQSKQTQESEGDCDEESREPEDGFYYVQDALDACEELSGYTVGAVVGVLAPSPPFVPVEGDDSGQRIRLRSNAERLRGAMEHHILINAAAGLSLLDMMQVDIVKALLPSKADTAERLRLLRVSLETSTQLVLMGSVVVPMQAVAPCPMLPLYWPDQAFPAPAVEADEAPLSDSSFDGKLAFSSDASSSATGRFRSRSRATPTPAGLAVGSAVPLRPPPAQHMWPSILPASFGSGLGMQQPTPCQGRRSYSPGFHSGPHRGRSLSPGFASPKPLHARDGSPWERGMRRRSLSPGVLRNIYPQGADQVPRGQRRFPNSMAGRRLRVSHIVADLLDAPTAKMMEKQADDGTINVLWLIEESQELRDEVFNNSVLAMRTLIGTSANQTRLHIDARKMRVRLATPVEQLSAALEQILLPTHWQAPMAIEGLLMHPLVVAVTAREISAGSGEGAGSEAALALLHEAVKASTYLETTEDVNGMCMVQVRGAGDLLYDEMERMLQEDPAAASIWKREQELPLAWVLEQSPVQKLLERLRIGSRNQALELLRVAIDSSPKYELDGARVSIRKRNASVGGRVPLEQVDEAIGDEAAEQSEMDSDSHEPVRRPPLRKKKAAGRPINATIGNRHKMELEWPILEQQERWGENSQWQRNIPNEKSIRRLRDLLDFYFQVFNLQHNSLLMSILQADHDHVEEDAEAPSHPKSRRHRAYWRPVRRYGPPLERRSLFRLQHLLELPRIERLLAQFDSDGVWALFISALEEQPHLRPVCITNRDSYRWDSYRWDSWNRAPARNSWQETPILELSYVPELRFIEALPHSLHRPEVKPFLASDPDPNAPARQQPASAISVVTYSVSSDLSDPMSPKAAPLLEAIASGELPDTAISWTTRLHKLRRQLLQHTPDIICVQGVQCMDFQDRCSEWEDGWFHRDPMPEPNHLAFLYRELSKSNYGVVWAPTLHVPAETRACLGNAIFWRRSRWQLESMNHVMPTAACAQLASRCTGMRIVVCSTKTSATYVRDWGGKLSKSEILEPLRTVQELLLERAAAVGATPIWCGDFGCEPRLLLQGLSEASSTSGLPARAKEVGGVRWHSACRTVLQENPWTMVHRDSQGADVNSVSDLILHNSALHPLAVLGSHCRNEKGLVEWIRDGNPSDHLLQLAIFSIPARPDDSASDSAPSDSENSSDSSPRTLSRPLLGVWAQPGRGHPLMQFQ